MGGPWTGRWARRAIGDGMDDGSSDGPSDGSIHGCSHGRQWMDGSGQSSNQKYRRGGITKGAASQSGHDAGPGINFSFTTPTGKQRNILRLKWSMLTKYDKKKASFSSTGICAFM